MIKVKVRDGMIGYYERRRYGKGTRWPTHEGDVFEIPVELFSGNWMKKLPGKVSRKKGGRKPPTFKESS